jgi:hypothetical protein
VQPLLPRSPLQGKVHTGDETDEDPDDQGVAVGVREGNVIGANHGEAPELQGWMLWSESAGGAERLWLA